MLTPRVLSKNPAVPKNHTFPTNTVQAKNPAVAKTALSLFVLPYRSTQSFAVSFIVCHLLCRSLCVTRRVVRCVSLVVHRVIVSSCDRLLFIVRTVSNQFHRSTQH